jgi:hypothetical protein
MGKLTGAIIFFCSVSRGRKSKETGTFPLPCTRFWMRLVTPLMKAEPRSKRVEDLSRLALFFFVLAALTSCCLFRYSLTHPVPQPFSPPVKLLPSPLPIPDIRRPADDLEQTKRRGRGIGCTAGIAGRRGYLSEMYGNDVSAGIPPLCILRARVRLAPEAERKTTTDEETATSFAKAVRSTGVEIKVPTGAPSSALGFTEASTRRESLVSKAIRGCMHILYLKGYRGTGHRGIYLGHKQSYSRTHLRCIWDYVVGCHAPIAFISLAFSIPCCVPSAACIP